MKINEIYCAFLKTVIRLLAIYDRLTYIPLRSIKFCIHSPGIRMKNLRIYYVWRVFRVTRLKFRTWTRKSADQFATMPKFYFASTNLFLFYFIFLYWMCSIVFFVCEYKFRVLKSILFYLSVSVLLSYLLFWLIDKISTVCLRSNHERSNKYFNIFMLKSY